MVGTAVSMKLDGSGTTAVDVLFELELPYVATLVFALLNAVPEKLKEKKKYQHRF